MQPNEEELDEDLKKVSASSASEDIIIIDTLQDTNPSVAQHSMDASTNDVVLLHVLGEMPPLPQLPLDDDHETKDSVAEPQLSLDPEGFTSGYQSDGIVTFSNAF